MGTRSAARLCRAAGFLLSALLAGCAAGYAPTPHWEVREAALRRLVPGVSTKDDVRRQVGVPRSEMVFARKGEEVWEYRYLQGGGTLMMIAHVHFDLQGVYKMTFHMIDPAFRGGRV